ncbi:MAG: hypothetical protein EOO28_36700 [Comamonadaceae bacterium]|nr:MAG: hypothetical protein EOO28_36700 [Comamonadaceae bacterium]
MLTPRIGALRTDRPTALGVRGLGVEGPRDPRTEPAATALPRSQRNVKGSAFVKMADAACDAVAGWAQPGAANLSQMARDFAVAVTGAAALLEAYMLAPAPSTAGDRALDRFVMQSRGRLEENLDMLLESGASLRSHLDAGTVSGMEEISDRLSSHDRRLYESQQRSYLPSPAGRAEWRAALASGDQVVIEEHARAALKLFGPGEQPALLGGLHGLLVRGDHQTAHFYTGLMAYWAGPQAPTLLGHDADLLGHGPTGVLDDIAQWVGNNERDGEDIGSDALGRSQNEAILGYFHAVASADRLGLEDKAALCAALKRCDPPGYLGQADAPRVGGEPALFHTAAQRAVLAGQPERAVAMVVGIAQAATDRLTKVVLLAALAVDLDDLAMAASSGQALIGELLEAALSADDVAAFTQARNAVEATGASFFEAMKDGPWLEALQARLNLTDPSP